MTLKQLKSLLVVIAVCFSTGLFAQGNGNGNGGGGNSIPGDITELETGLNDLTQTVTDLGVQLSGDIDTVEQSVTDLGVQLTGDIDTVEQSVTDLDTLLSNEIDLLQAEVLSLANDVENDLQSLFTDIQSLSVQQVNVACVVGDELQVELDNASLAGAILNVSGSCDAVRVEGLRNILIAGDGSASISGTVSTSSAVVVADSSNVQISNISIQGNDNDHALRADNSSVEIDDVDISGGSLITVLADRNSSVEISGSLTIDRENAASGLTIRRSSSVISEGNLTISSTAQGNTGSAIGASNNSSFVQTDGFVNSSGSIGINVNSYVQIINGSLIGYYSPLTDSEGNVTDRYILGTAGRNSSFRLIANNPSHSITAQGSYSIFSGSNFDINAIGAPGTHGTVTHTAVAPIVAQRNTNIQLLGSGIIIDYGTVLLRQGSVLDSIALSPNNLIISELKIESGSGARVAGGGFSPNNRMDATCNEDESIWTKLWIECTTLLPSP